MKFQIKDNHRLTISGAAESGTEEQVSVYKLTSLNWSFGEEHSKDLYVAVPDGRKISILDLPAGEYELKKLNRGINEAFQEEAEK